MGLAYLCMYVGGNLVQVGAFNRLSSNNIGFILEIFDDYAYVVHSKFQLSSSFIGASIGPLAGLFILGALFPCANWKVSIRFINTSQSELIKIILQIIVTKA